MHQSLIALHGFLGRPSDWNPFEFKNLEAIDLYALPGDGLAAWARQINTKAQACTSPVLMGYSLGGRVALHALIDTPHLWKAAIIISAHPGLSDSSEKKQRLINDAKWSNRFLEEDWNSLIADWNQRAVFLTGHFNFERQEQDYQRTVLAQWLKAGSLGLQNDLRAKIIQLDLPILWMCGEKDQTYLSLAHSVHLSHPHSTLLVVPEAGHRLPWENPLYFKEKVEGFLEKI